MKTATEFVYGKNGIGYVSQEFTDAFGEIEFEHSEKKLVVREIPHPMSNKEIIEELKPEECTISELFAALTDFIGGTIWNECYVCYIRKPNGDLLAINAHYTKGYGWDIEASPIEKQQEWRLGNKVFSTAFDFEATL